MRVLILSQYFWPENFRILEVAKSLLSRCAKVDVLTGKPNYPAGKVFPGYRWWGCTRESHDGLDIHRVPLIPRGRGGLRLIVNYWSFVFSAALFGPRLLFGKKYDVFFVYAPSPILQALPAIFLAWLKGGKVVLWVQDLWPQSLSATGHVNNRVALKIVELIVRFIYRRVDLLLLQSEAFAEPVRALSGRTRLCYFPNSVDETFSAPSTAILPVVAGMDAPFPVLFAGNLGTAQAVDVIIEAAANLRDHPDIQFVVMGNGSRREWMLEEVKKRRLTNVHLPGHFPLELMPGFMQKAAALLVTLADHEIFSYTVPSKVQAYLAAGRPILAGLNGEGGRIVREAGAGVVSPAEDGAGLAAAVLDLYGRSPEERESMGRSGKRYFQEHYSHEMLIDRLCVIFNEMDKEMAAG